MNISNRTIYVGDNLPVLRGIDSDCVDLIATDPPFNSGRVFTGSDGQVLNDSWRWQAEYTEWLDSLPNRKVVEVVEAALHAHSRGLAAFLCFMGVRLVEMERVLKRTGTIYVQCDDRAGHYLKALMDAIWGEGRFMADIVWERAKGDKVGNNWGRNHDNLLVYGAGRINKEAIKQPLKAKQLAKYSRTDKHGAWADADMGAQSVDGWLWEGVRGKWRASQALPSHFIKPAGYDDWPVAKKLDAQNAAGLIHWTSNGTPRFKRYLSTSTGEAPTNVWTDIDPLNAMSADRKRAKNWTTQKPVPLYERIVLASSKPGDLVLDPFCGCATTCIAAAIHGRAWVGIEKERQVVPAMTGYMKAKTGEENLFEKPRILFTAPRRTDGEQVVARPRGRRARKVSIPRAAWMDARQHLAARHGTTCQGCGTAMPALHHLELDHITPKAKLLEWNPAMPDEHINHPSNLTLLCSHCNRVKGDRLTLADLRALQCAPGA